MNPFIPFPFWSVRGAGDRPQRAPSALVWMVLVLLLFAFGYLVLRPASLPSGDELILREASFEPLSMGRIPVNIKAAGLSKARFDDGVSLAKQEIDRLSALISAWNPDSLLSRLNRGEPSARLPESFWFVLSRSLELSRLSGGTFDPTVGPLIDLWRSAEKKNELPTEDEIEAARSRVGFEKVLLERSQEGTGLLRFSRPGVEIDLGGVAKGWFADRIASLFRELGAVRVIVTVGGDMVLWDENSKALFNVAIRHPREPDRVFAVLAVSQGAVSTSGGYFRFFRIGGESFPHIIDPRTGTPARELLSATVFASNGLEADALSTAVFILGQDKGLELASSREGVEALLIREKTPGGDFDISLSPGLSGRLRLSDAPHRERSPD